MSRTAWIIVVVVALLVMLACAVTCVAVAGLVAFRAGTDSVAVSERIVSGVQERVVREVGISSPGTLEVRNRWGNVTIEANGTRDVIEVDARKEARSVFGQQGERLLQEVQVVVDGDGTRASVHVTGLEGVRFGEVSVDLLITVPEEMDVIVLNEAGNILVKGTEGSIRVRNEAGNVRLEDVTVTESIDVASSAGNVVFEGRLPELGTEPVGWEVLLKTQAGNVEFSVPADSAFTLSAETEVGLVNSGFELQDMESGRLDGNVGHWLKGGVNRSWGSPNVILRTTAGNITVKPLP